MTQSEGFKNTLEEIKKTPDDMEVEMVKQWKEDTERSYLRYREFEKSLGIAFQTIKRLEEMRQAEQLGKTEEELRGAVLEEGKEVNFFTTGKSQQGVVSHTVCDYI